jgi:enoyl-CoA hydratase
MANRKRIGYLDVQLEERIGTIFMDRNEKLNAMTTAFWTDLRDALDWLEGFGDARVVILSGNGGRAFSAGGDIREFLSLETLPEMEAYQRDAMAAFAHIERSPLIVMAAVNGLALGGGCELVLACDFAIAADTATFAMPEASLGLVPGFGVIRAPQLIGPRLTKYLIATGLTIDAQRAYEAGLVESVVSAATLMQEARAIAARIAERSPNAVCVAKRMINRTIDFSELDYSVQQITALHASADRAAGVAAFLARTMPEFAPRRSDSAE